MINGWHSGSVVNSVASQQEGPASESAIWVLSVRRLLILSMFLWVSSHSLKLSIAHRCE